MNWLQLPPLAFALIRPIDIGRAHQDVRIAVHNVPGHVANVEREAFDQISHGRRPIDDASSSKSLNDAIVYTQCVRSGSMGNVVAKDLLFRFSESQQALPDSLVPLTATEHPTERTPRPFNAADKHGCRAEQKCQPDPLALVFRELRNSDRFQPALREKQEHARNEPDGSQVTRRQLEDIGSTGQEIVHPLSLRASNRREFVGTVDATRDTGRATARTLEQVQGNQRSAVARIEPMADPARVHRAADVALYLVAVIGIAAALVFNNWSPL